MLDEQILEVVRARLKPRSWGSGTTAAIVLCMVLSSAVGSRASSEECLAWAGDGYIENVGDQKVKVVYGNHSMKEMCQTDTFGESHTLPRPSRQFLLKQIKEYDKMVSEVYSVPRATSRSTNPWTAFDIRTGWNFSRRDHGQQAVHRLRQERPALLMLSPPCTMYSIIQSLNKFRRDEAKFQRLLQEALELL